MRRIRTLSSRRLAAIVAAVAALAATAGIAQAGLGSDPKPAPKPLDRAIHDAVTAPQVAGVSARISFTNGLLPGGAMGGEEGSPLSSGADGRLWLAADGRFRLELQSDAGDAQITSDGTWITVFDASSDIVYRLAQPVEKASADHEEPSLAGIRRGLERLGEAWTLSGARPSSTAGRPSYTVRIAPKDDGGLLGAGELAWDADKGVPLRAAVYAQGQTDPVLELEATEISYGAIDQDDLLIEPPAGAAVVEIEPPAGHGRGGGNDVRGVDAVRRELDFELAAPDELAGLPRRQVRLVRMDGQAGALTTYGEGLGGLIVFQHRAMPRRLGSDSDSALPRINIDGATGTELATALGTMVTFERDGVSYTVVGSVPPAAAENAARDLR